MVIDAHVHLYPGEINRDPAGWAAAHGERHWSQLCTRLRKNGRPVQDFPEVGDLLREMDAAGIDRAVLMGWYWENPDSCERQNTFYAECVRRHPDRLHACASVHPAAGRDAAREAILRARDAGFCGLGEMSPHSQGYDTGDPVFREILALASELGLPVNLHVTDPASAAYPGRIETPLADFLGLAEAFPDLRFILAHWGGRLPLVGRGSGRDLPANLHYDTAASPLLYDASIWRQFLAVAPQDRLLFGSDYPLRLYPRTNPGDSGLVSLVREARDSGVDLSALAANACRVFQIRSCGR